MLTVTSTEIQNNFGKYLQLVQSENEIVIMKNGSQVASLISKNAVISSLSSSFRGILKDDIDEKELRNERIKHNESID